MKNMGIYKKIKQLNPEQRNEFKKNLLDCLDDPSWLAANNLDVNNPDQEIVAERVYGEMFEGKNFTDYWTEKQLKEFVGDLSPIII